MAILTKNALSASNQASFPNNTTGAITPLILRNFNQDVIDTLVDSLNTGSYAITTGSNDFTQPNNFTSISASSFVSASAFVGDGSKLTNITASVAIPISEEGVLLGYATQLNFSGSNISASLAAGIATISVNTNNLVTTSSFNSFTASQNTKNSTLATYTASVDTKFTAVGVSTSSLNTFTGSQNTKNSTLATYTASVDTKFATLGTQSGSWITESESGSFLITASVNLNTITFTKGDNTTFAVIVNTGSAVTTDLTSLNAFTASQDTKNTTLANVTSSLNASTASQQSQIDNLIAATGSYITTPLTSLNSFTASQDTKNSTLATYTASVDTKFSTLGTQSGSWITESETASFARTNVDNNFTANQTFTNITAVSASFTYVQTLYETSSVIYSSGSNQFGDELSDIQTLSGSVKVQGTLTINGLPVATGSTDISSLNAFTASQETKNSTLATYTASVDSSLTNLNSFTASNGNTSLNSYTASNDTKWSNLAGQTGSYVTSAITASSLVTASVNLNTITFTKGDASTFNITVNTGSGGGGTTDITSLNSFTASQETKDTTLASVTASLNSATASLFTSTSLSLTTASFSGNTLTFTKGDTTTFGIVLPDVSGSTIDTGSFATTGSNVFTGDQTLVDASGNSVTLTDGSGSLILVAKSYTSASAHLSSSVNQVNLIFKNNNNTADTIISGSNNIFTNPIAPQAGFKRFATSGNISLVGNLPQMSGSMAFPITLSNNYFGSVTGTTFLGMRGPVSSSAWNINNNIVQLGVNIGSSAALHAEKLVSGLTLNSNNLLGSLNLIANQSALSSSVTISGNIIAGTTTLNLSSSAAALANNIINDSNFTLTNQFYSSSLGLGSVAMNRNNIGGQSNSIIISGSLPAGTTTTNSLSDNFIFGGSNTIYVDVANARVSGSTAYINAIRTGLMGNSLIVSGSSLLADLSSFGSVFVGRYNADDSRRNKTSDIVFAVGTGNTTTRKTGFLIDSGSNTFVEGTLNVSGSSSFTGSANFVGGDVNFTDQGRNINIDVDGTIIKGQKAVLISQSLDIQNTFTASLQQGYVWVGNATNRTTLVATSSFGGTLPNDLISSSAQITALGFVSSSITASSVVTASVNLNTITFTKGDASTFALTVDTGSGGGGAAFPYTGNAVITGSLGVSGSMFGGVITLSVASTTASVDFSAANMFTLSLPSASTHINPTNIRAGQTVNIQITQPTPGTGSVTFPSNVKFAGGNDYQATTTGSAIDMLTLVSYDGTNVLATSIKNFL